MMALQSDEHWKRYLLKGTTQIRNIYLHIVLITAVHLCMHPHVYIILFVNLLIAYFIEFV